MRLPRSKVEAAVASSLVDAFIEIITGIFAFHNIRRMFDSRINKRSGDGRHNEAERVVRRGLK
jgi:hypothetical protein